MEENAVKGAGQEKIDMRDRKILAELDWNARISNSELAKRVGLSKKAIEYRIKRLEGLKVISGYYPIINFGRLGYASRRVWLNLQHADSKLKKEIEDYIKNKNSGIGWAIWIRGFADLVFVVYTKSLGQFKKTFNKFNTKFGKYIKSREFSSTSGFEHYPYSFIGGKKDKSEIVIDEEKNAVKIDDLDKKIIFELSSNARQNSSEIARKVKSNYKTVSYRIKQLEKNRILMGTRTQINNYTLGYNDYYKVLIYFNYYSDKIYNDVKEYLKSLIETVYFVYHIDSDIDVEMVFKSDVEFFDFLDKLNEKFPDLIKEVKYAICYKTIHVSYLPSFED